MVLVESFGCCFKLGNVTRGRKVAHAASEGAGQARGFHKNVPVIMMITCTHSLLLMMKELENNER